MSSGVLAIEGAVTSIPSRLMELAPEGVSFVGGDGWFSSLYTLESIAQSNILRMITCTDSGSFIQQDDVTVNMGFSFCQFVCVSLPTPL